MIQLDSVSFTYDEADGPSLDAISLSVGKGRLVGIAGADASGRSTLFRVLNGTAPCVFPGKLTGRIAVDGKVPAECGHAALGQTVASVFDDPDAQIVSLTAEEEVAFALVQRGVPLAEVHERVGQALERVGLAGFGQRSTSSLSGGQKQRLVMASALALKPAILLVDEGTCALDPAGARHFHRLIREMVDRDRCTAIVIERDLGLLFEVADEIHVLSRGKIAVGGSRADVAQRYALLRELGLRVPAWLELCGLLRERGLLDAPLPSSEGEALSLLAALEARRVPA